MSPLRRFTSMRTLDCGWLRRTDLASAQASRARVMTTMVSGVPCGLTWQLAEVGSLTRDRVVAAATSTMRSETYRATFATDDRIREIVDAEN